MREYLKQSGLAAVIVASILSVAILPKNVSQRVVFVLIVVWALAHAVLFCIRHKGFFKSESIKKVVALSKDSQPETEEQLHFKHLKIQLGHRITDRLHSLYPCSTWDWKEKPTVSLFTHGGRVRIITANTDIYQEAEVVMDNVGRMEVNMLTVSSIRDIVQKEYESAVTDYTIDVKTWYEQRAAGYLTELITDLNSKGTKTLIIEETGCIKIDSDKQVGLLNAFPAKNLWKQLIGILEEEDLKVVELHNGLQIGW